MLGLSIGELSRNTLMSQQNRQIKNKIEALSEQMVTGQVKDITKHLNGNFHELADIEHRLKALKHYKQSMQQAASILNVTQLRQARQYFWAVISHWCNTVCLVHALIPKYCHHRLFPPTRRFQGQKPHPTRFQSTG